MKLGLSLFFGRRYCFHFSFGALARDCKGRCLLPFAERTSGYHPLLTKQPFNVIGCFIIFEQVYEREDP